MITHPSSNRRDLAVVARALGRSYRFGDAAVWALRDVTFNIEAAEAVAVAGPSGSGKTTLLNLIGGLDRPSRGEVVVLEQDLRALNEAKLTQFRAGHVGFVFQDPNLLPGLSALENVMVARLPWERGRELEARAHELLSQVGLGDRQRFPPSRLSGGERQRVGLARALVAQPPLLLADEPTGNLDAATTDEIISLLERLRNDYRFTLVIASHDPAVIAIADRVLHLHGGQLKGESDHRSRPELRVREIE